MLAIIFLLIGILSRLMTHTPNFTPILALALFGGMTLKKDQAVWFPLTLMILSDLILGLHALIPLTWGSLLMISLLGRRQRQAGRSAAGVAGLSLLSAVIFFVLTNLGAWLVMYPRTWAGLAQCFVLAIPFFRNTLFSTLLYSGVLFGMHELAARRVRGTSLAWMVGG